MTKTQFRQIIDLSTVSKKKILHILDMFELDMPKTEYFITFNESNPEKFEMEYFQDIEIGRDPQESVTKRTHVNLYINIDEESAYTDTTIDGLDNITPTGVRIALSDVHREDF